MKKILLPTDFSEIAGYALKYAANMAKKHDAEIIALYMIDREDAFLTRKEAMDLYQNIDYHQRINKSFDEFLNKDYLEGIKVSSEIRRQVDFKSISELTDELDIDLVIIGSHGAHGIGGMIIGSNAEKVIRTSNVPVLVVKRWKVIILIYILIPPMILVMDLQKTILTAYMICPTIKTNSLY